MARLINGLLKNLRQKYRPDLSQGMAADALGIQRSHMNKLERGGVNRLGDEALAKIGPLYGLPDVWVKFLTELPELEHGESQLLLAPQLSPFFISNKLEDLPCYGFRTFWREAPTRVPADIDFFGLRSEIKDRTPLGPTPMIVTEQSVVSVFMTLTGKEMDVLKSYLKDQSLFVILPGPISPKQADDMILFDEVMLMYRSGGMCSLAVNEGEINSFRQRYTDWMGKTYPPHLTQAALERCSKVARHLQKPLG